MLEALRDPLWQFVGALLTLLAIGISYFIYLAQRRRPGLAFGVLSNQALLTVAESIQSRVALTFDQKPVSNVHVVNCGVKNIGNTPIRTADFEEPFRIHIPPQTLLLSAEITEKSPESLKVELATSESSVELKPLLLNPGDSAVLRLLVAGETSELRYHVRVVGISNPFPLVPRVGPFFSPERSVAWHLGWLFGWIVWSAIGAAFGVFLVSLFFGRQFESAIVGWYVFGTVVGIASLLVTRWVGRLITKRRSAYIRDA